MPCYHPWVPAGGRSAKRPLACGQCIGCRLEYSRDWAVRIVHEAQMHEHNVFVTLTYKVDPVTLVPIDWKRFIRRVVDAYGPTRYFMGGEYGERGGRPHFHAVLFGRRFADGRSFGKSGSGFPIFESGELSDLWSHGFASYGAVTFESAAYIARYVMKKVNGDAAAEHYGGRLPEYCRMSLKPGIGSTWFDKFGESDVKPRGKVYVNGHECNAPRYYFKLLAKKFPRDAERLAEERRLLGLAGLSDSSNQRLASKEAVQRAAVGFLQRKV